MSAPRLQNPSRPIVHVGAVRRVVIGRGDRRVTFQSGPAAHWTGPTRRIALEAVPRQVLVGGRQGIAGPPGPPGPPPAVINVLDSSSTVAALAANQGRVLDGKITQVRTDYGSHETDFASQFSSMIS